MEKTASSCSILRSLNLDNIEEALTEAYHKTGAGRPPRKPIGIFKALIAKRVKQIPSDRELYRRLWTDEDLREICDIEDYQKPYHPSQLTRFRDRLGVKRLEEIMHTMLDELIDNKVVSGKKVVFDATFIKAYSKRDLHDNSRGGSDPEARVGRNGKTYELGGPEVLTWENMVKRVAEGAGKNKIVLPMPIGLMKFAATLFDWLPFFPATRDQLTMLAEGNVADPAALELLIGRPAAAFSAENLSYLRNRDY